MTYSSARCSCESAGGLDFEWAAVYAPCVDVCPDLPCGGTSSSGKIAVTGHSGWHAPQSMHSSGWM
jgi:hypothetical protein